MMRYAHVLIGLGLLWGQADWQAYKKAKRSTDKMRILYTIGMQHFHNKAFDSVSKIVQIAQGYTSPEAKAVYYLLQAQIALHEGDVNATKDYSFYAEKVAFQSDDIFWPIQTYRVKGALCESMGQWAAAETAYRKMATLSEDALYIEGAEQAKELLERLKTLQASAL